jgi:hypothetical protein
MLVAILTGAVTTHIVNHDSLADSIIDRNAPGPRWTDEQVAEAFEMSR